MGVASFRGTLKARVLGTMPRSVEQVRETFGGFSRELSFIFPSLGLRSSTVPGPKPGCDSTIQIPTGTSVTIEQ